MALSSNKYVQRLEKILVQKAPLKGPNGEVMAILKDHPKPAFSEKVQRGDQGKFFKNRPKSSLRLIGPKALWRKLNYTPIKMHLK